MKSTCWKYLLVSGILFIAAFQSVYAQHIYVRSNTETVGGWIVDDQGQTFFELPAGWRLDNNSGPATLIHDWPVLLEHYPRLDSAGHSFLHEDGRWEVLSNYQKARALGEGCYWLGWKDSKNGVLRCGEEEVVLQNTQVQSAINADGFAVAYVRPPEGRIVRGLINRKGEWVLPPQAEILVFLGQNRYYFRDTLQQDYLLRINKSTLELSVDTVLNLSERKWELHSTLPFDETGHTWVSLGEQQHLIIDTMGQVSSDTISTYSSYRRPFQSGLSWVGKPKQLVGVDGQTVLSSTWEYGLVPSEERIVVQDKASGFFGYLNSTGNWAIPPVYCFASSFRDGLALTTGAPPESCGDRIVERRSTPSLPAFLQRYQRVEYHELLDTTGQVVWADSCRTVYLLPGRIIIRNQSPSLLAPALRIDWLENGQYWLSPDYHFSRWDQLAAAQVHDVKRIDLGAGKYRFGLNGGNYPLPEHFSERLTTWPYLETLALNFHQMAVAWPQIIQLENLQRLSLSYCSLESLPNEIGQLRALTHLDISTNQLTELPNSLYRMRHLQELNVADNPLPPETIVRLRKRLPDTKIVYKREW